MQASKSEVLRVRCVVLVISCHLNFSPQMAVAKVLTVTFVPYQERDGLGGLAVARGRGRGRGDWSVSTPGGVQEITYTVPADKCGLVIGKGKRQLSCSRRGSQFSDLYP